MYSPSEQSYKLQSLSSSQAAVLPHTDLSVTQQLIEHIIPERVWSIFEHSAEKNDFYYTSAFKLDEQQKISKAVFDQMDIFWDKARAFEAQGYTLHELKLQIHFKSEIAQTEVACEVIANQTGGDFTLTQTQMDDASALIRITKTIINPEFIPLVIAAVSDGNVPDGLSMMMVDNIKRMLTEHPNLMVNEITQMSYEDHLFPLFDVTIKPSLSFQPPSVPKETISSESKMVSGLCKCSFFREQKRTGAAELSTCADLSLTTGSK